MEIEKKFLVKNIPFDLDEYDVYQLEQGYLATYPTVRIRKCNEDYYLTYKKKGLSEKHDKNVIVNDEIDLELNETSYMQLKAKIDGNLVVKDRYIIPLGNELYAEMDIFKEQLAGLIMIEVEFENEEQAIAFEPPEWFGEDVSDDHKYRNVYLSTVNSVVELEQ